MEKAYHSKLALMLLLSIVLISPVGVFIYAFFKISVESISAASPQILEHIQIDDLVFSLTVSAVATALSALIGAFISYYLLNQRNHSHDVWILNIVLVLPHIGFAYIVYLFFSETGFLFRLFNLLGISPSFYLINDRMGIGIMLNYILKEVPFVVLYLLATSRRENIRHIFAARDLGAGYFECFRKIYLPLNMVQLVTVSIVMFAFVLGNYEVPFLLGANAPQFLSVSALNNFQSIDIDQNNASYIKTLIIFAAAFALSIVLRLLARNRR